MASILDRYGIKEVADVTFYKIDETTGNPSYPVLYLDTLKVSTIEQTAETTDARGGKGNPKLISWDYGKEITVTLEDALFSAKSMSIMFGNGKFSANDIKTGTKIERTSMARVAAEGGYAYFMADRYDSVSKGAVRNKIWLTSDSKALSNQEGMLLENSGVKITRLTTEDGATTKTYTAFTAAEWETFVSTLAAGAKVFVTYELTVNSSTIVISGDSFPGTYYVTGDTYARSDVSGADQFFQFIIPKAKVTSENTITLEAEGDPSVFNMNLTVLRPESGEMMRLVQYELVDVQG